MIKKIGQGQLGSCYFNTKCRKNGEWSINILLVNNILICLFNWRFWNIVSDIMFCFIFCVGAVVFLWSVNEVVILRFHGLSYFGFCSFFQFFGFFPFLICPFFLNGCIWLGIVKIVVWKCKYIKKYGLGNFFMCVIVYLMIYNKIDGVGVNKCFQIKMVIFRFQILKINFVLFIFFCFGKWCVLILNHHETLRHLAYGLPFGRLRR